MATINSWNNQIAASNNTIVLNGGTNGVVISADASAATVNIATGAAIKTVTVGSTTASSLTTIQSPSGGIKLIGVSGVSVSNLNYVTIDTTTGQMGSAATTASVSVIGTRTNAVLNTLGATFYQSPYNSAGYTTAAQAYFVMPCAATLSNLYVYAETNASTTNCTTTLYVNGSTTALVVTVTALTTGVFSDTTHSVSVSAGDLICWQLNAATTGAIGGSISMKITA